MTHETPAPILLPPVSTLLGYIRDGWSVDHDDFNNGFPRDDRSAPDFLAELGAMLVAPDGLHKLAKLALMGMIAWGVDKSMANATDVKAAFESPGMRDRLAALYPGRLPIIPAALMAAPDTVAPSVQPKPGALPMLAAPAPMGPKPVPPSPLPPAAAAALPVMPAPLAPAPAQKRLPAPKQRRNRKAGPGPG